MAELKLPFALARPDGNTPVANAQDIGYEDSNVREGLNRIGANASSVKQPFNFDAFITKISVASLPNSGKGIRASDGVSVDYEEYKHSDYIPVAELSYIVLNTSSANTFGCAFYSDTNESSFVSGIVNTTGVRTIQVPFGAKYFRWCSGNGSGYYAQYPIYQDLGSAVSIKTTLTLKNGYYSGTTVGNTMGGFTANSSFRAAESEVSDGDIVVINGTGGSGGSRLYAFVNSSNVIVAVAAASFVAENLALVVPSTAVKVYVTSTDTSNTSVTVYTDIRKKEEKDILAVQASMSQMQTAINGSINGLQTEINNVKGSVMVDKEVKKNATTLTVQNEGINYSTGAASSYTDYWRSDFLEVKGGSTLKIYTYPANSFGIAFYSSNNESSYISGDKNTNELRTLTVPANAKYFRWCNSGRNTNYYVEFVFQESMASKFDDVEEAMGDMQTEIDDIETSLEPEEEITYPATDLTFRNEGIKASTGQVQSYTDYWRSDFVHVKGGSTLEIYTVSAGSFGIAFYSSNNESSYISGDVNTSSKRTLTVPQNAKYFRWCNSGRGASHYVKYIDSKSIPEQLNELKQPVVELQVNVANIIADKYAGLDASTRAINVLLIGNSYSRDLAVYIPQMLSSIGITNYKIGIAFRSGCSIQMHAQAGDSAVYYYDSNSGNGWTTESEKTLSYCVQKEDWDIILLQQVSFNAGYKYKNYTTTYLSTLLDTINGYLASSNNFSGSVKYGWVATPAYTTGSDDLETHGYETSEEMAKDIWKLAVYLFENYHFQFIVPTCIALEYARKTTLNQYGDYNPPPHSEAATGGIMYFDSSQHLVEGIGRQIAGYVGLISLFGQSCMGNKARFTTQSNLQPHGSAVGSDDANSYIAQKCVIDAFKNIDF